MRFATIIVTVLWLASGHALADEVQDEQQRLRKELAALRASYESRIRELETRLESLEQLARQPVAPVTATLPEVTSPAPATGGGLTSNDYNPAISLTLQGSLNGYTRDPDEYSLPGFQLGGDAGLAAEGLTLDETELTAAASVDQLFFGQATLGLHEDADGTEVDIEEAFVEPLALPAGLGGRFGRFYSDVGYLNSRHTHTWDFHDAPLVYRAFLGRQYRDDGLRLSWTAPTAVYLSAGAETFAGNRFPGGDSETTLGDVQTAFLKLGGDVGTGHAWQAGLSALLADAHERESGHGHGHDGGAATSVFSGDSDLYGAELVWKWAPGGNPRVRNFIFQTEAFYREEDGEVRFAEEGDQALLGYDGDQWGLYVQGVYQFRPRWRIGARYDRLQADNALQVRDPGGFSDPGEVIAESGFDDEGYTPERYSLMLDWSPSEYSRLRAQYNRDESYPGAIDHQWSLQYLMSLGSHAAHAF